MNKRSSAWYHTLYAILLRLYPKSHRERYAEGMQQTFRDLLRERECKGYPILASVLWVLTETFVSIIKINVRAMVMNKRIVRLVLVVAFLLLIPLVAMQFTAEVVWTPFDFLAMSVLLFGAGLLYEFISRRMVSRISRLAAALAVLSGVLLVWLNLAVGLIGSENNPANQLYDGVILIGLVGTLWARFDPARMSRALIATAIAQFLVPIIAILIWRSSVTQGEGPDIAGVFLLNGVFVALWLVSAWMFRNSIMPPSTNSVLE